MHTSIRKEHGSVAETPASATAAQPVARKWSPLARSPISPAAPVVVESGWQVCGRRCTKELTIADHTPLAKVAVRAPVAGAMATALGVPRGRAGRDRDGALVVGSGPGEWLVLAPPGTASQVFSRVAKLATAKASDEFVSIADLTHGRVLIRITGKRTTDVMARVCAMDLSDRTIPNGSAFRSAVARVATDVIRDDRGRGRSYLLHCERSSGQYLFNALANAGAEFGIDVDGFAAPGI
jgi:heterotetrameric sarcosine oxidase gamma subunit